MRDLKFSLAIAALVVSFSAAAQTNESDALARCREIVDPHHVQFFSGYGDTLLDYNFRKNSIGLGISIGSWY